METTFLQNSIQTQGTSVHPDVLYFGIIFWGILSFLGILFWKHPSIGKKGILFSILIFAPLSLVCIKSYKETKLFSYEVVLDGEKKEVRLGDTKEEQDVVFPFAEWTSYQIHSDAESKKDGWNFTDTIYLKHQSGLLVPVSKVTNRKYNEKAEEFSRYLILNRELKKFYRFLSLPIEDELGDPFPPLPIPLQANQNTNSLKVTNVEDAKHTITFPIQWNHSISNANWFFTFSLLSIGHLGLLITLVNLTNKESNNLKIGFTILLLGYLGFGTQLSFSIVKKIGLSYQMEATEKGYVLLAEKNGNRETLGEWKQESEFRKHLDLPSKTLWFQSKESYESTRNLAKSLLDPNSELTSTLNHTKNLFTSANAQSWDLSDLPMEVAVRFFLVLH
ncbi:hypothetical protein AB3N58_16460 [Leptospira sp. WS60.C2]